MQPNEYSSTEPQSPDTALAASSHKPSAEALLNAERSAIHAILREHLDEQRRARRWRIFFRFAYLILFVCLLFALFSDGSSKSSGGMDSEHTALVQITGEIALDSLNSAEAVNQSLRSAFEESQAKGVILRINSPGGSPVQSAQIYDEIVRLKALHKKPLYVVVDEVCASGGYFVAAAADKIFVNRASLVGSVGVIMDSFGFTGMMEKLGVERRAITAGENKGFLDPFAAQNPKHIQHAQTMLAEVHSQFIEAVKLGRGKRLKAEQSEIFSGLVFTGERSVELGLADEFGDMDHVARDVIKAESLVDYSHRENLVDRVARRFGASFAQTITSHLKRFKLH
jgi:protease IV